MPAIKTGCLPPSLTFHPSEHAVYNFCSLRSFLDSSTSAHVPRYHTIARILPCLLPGLQKFLILNLTALPLDLTFGWKILLQPQTCPEESVHPQKHPHKAITLLAVAPHPVTEQKTSQSGSPAYYRLQSDRTGHHSTATIETPATK
jgi:hypothetical protein